MAAVARHLLLTGAPGCGKTTLVRRVVASVERSGVAARATLAGFTSEEIREGGRRVGFRLVPLGGEARVMAHVDRPGSPRVSRYGVDVAAIDAVADAELGPGRAGLYVVDEIGKMELFSDVFVARVRALLDGEAPVLATVAARGGGFVAEAKRHPEVEIVEVSAGNREALVDDLAGWVRRAVAR